MHYFFISPSVLFWTFSFDVGWPFNLTNGEYTFSKDVLNNYLFINYFYKLPEFLIFLYVVSLPILILNYKRFKMSLNFFLKILSVTILLLFPHLILIFIIYPIYDGLRLFLWATPYLAIIPAITFYALKKKKKFFVLTKYTLALLIFYIS